MRPEHQTGVEVKHQHCWPFKDFKGRRSLCSHWLRSSKCHHILHIPIALNSVFPEVKNPIHLLNRDFDYQS